MSVVTILNERAHSPLVLTCEHASFDVPHEYDDLGLDLDDLREHIGWDIGAAEVTTHLAQHFGATGVLCGISRLVIDCNRALGDHDLIVHETHGVRVPGNANVDALERQRRIRDFYDPYHNAIDQTLAGRVGARLLSVHSFTPELNNRERRFDVGLLFDTYEADARQVGAALTAEGLGVRYNEPYSGLDGLIFSARRHGVAHAVRYLEIEVNNRLLRDAVGVERISGAIASALRHCWEV